MKRVLPAIRLIAGAAIFAACDEPSGGNTCASTGAPTVDARSDSTFDPPSLTITPGQKVCWQNLSSLTHTMTSNVVTDSIDITLPPNFTFTQGFGTVQDFNYHCRFHPGMVGLIQVRP